MKQDVVLVLEIQVDRTVCYPRFLGNLGDCGQKEALIGENFDGGLQNPMVFFAGFVVVANNDLPGNAVSLPLMNEHSFI
ncbi:MAG: hypothetical protein LJE65_14850 [Desulfobacteraceae bacterium]|nr:hypothetical protein [Desulfobacteraceae bacterium]